MGFGKSAAHDAHQVSTTEAADWFDDRFHSQLFLLCKTSRETTNIYSILASDGACEWHR